MTYRVLVKENGKPIMIKSLHSGMDVLEFIGKWEKQGLEAKLL